MYLKPQFQGLRAAAANIGSGNGNYTLEAFQQDYPQFFDPEGEPLLPESLLLQLIDQANCAVQPDKWLSMWRLGAGLYTAHLTTLMLRTYAPSSSSPQQAAASGALMGVPKSGTLGDGSVEYDATALITGTEDWGDLNATTYGQLFASRARLIGMAGTLAI